MIRISSEQELLDSFRPLDQFEVVLPPLLTYPFLLKDYLAWTEASGHRIFLLTEAADRRAPLGIVFKRSSGTHSSSPPSMCEWCHSVRSGDGVALLTATASSRRNIGIYLCRDLGCKDSADGRPERDRVRRIVQRMTDFARCNLF